jgi:hypothetical protein
VADWPTVKLPQLELSTSFIKLITSFLINRKFKVLVEGEFSVPRKIFAEMPEGSVLALLLYSLYTNDDPAETETHLALFADDTFIYATEKHKRRVLCNWQRGLIAVKSYCQRCDKRSIKRKPRLPISLTDLEPMRT